MVGSLTIKEDAAPPYYFQEKTIQFLSKGKGRLEGAVTHPETGEKAEAFVLASAPGRGILYIDPGLGKSRMAIETACRLDVNIDLHWKHADYILVLCSKKALNTWRREWAKWTTVKQERVVIVEPKGSNPRKARQQLWERYNKGGRIFVVTYQSGALDFEAGRIPKHLLDNIKMVIADECKIWINRKTKNFKVWHTYMQKVPYVVMMDGTIMKKGPQDLWTFYNILKPKMFGSYWKWVNTFCNVMDFGFGKEILGPKNTDGLGKLMSHTMIKLKDDHPDVKGSRPPLTRDFKLVEMTSEQKQVYDSLVDNLFAITPSGEFIGTPSRLGLTVKLRQLLICPKIIDPSMGYGAAIEHLQEELEEDPHSVIFTPFTKAIPFIQQAIRERSVKDPYVLVGGTPSDEVGRIETLFNSQAEQDRPLICSIGFAESFELWSAKRCYFVGYDWMQITNYQAEKRLHRLITPHPVNSYYYRYMDTVDDDILDKLNSNVTNTTISFQDYFGALERRRRNKMSDQ